MDGCLKSAHDRPGSCAVLTCLTLIIFFFIVQVESGQQRNKIGPDAHLLFFHLCFASHFSPPRQAHFGELIFIETAVQLFVIIRSRCHTLDSHFIHKVFGNLKVI